MTREITRPVAAHHRWLIAILLAASSLHATTRLAHGEEDAERLERVQQLDDRARELYAAGDYEGAMAEMQAAQALMASTVRLYNMAACHERLGQMPEAINLFERFIAAGDAPADRVAAARERLAQLRSRLDTEVRGEAPAGSPDDEAGQQVAPDPTQEQSSWEDEPRERRRLRPVAFFASLGVTLAAGISMAVVGGVALAKHGDYEEMAESGDYTRTDQEVVSLRTTGNALTIVTDVLLGVTSAAAIATVLLAVFTRWRSEPSSRRFTLAPIASASTVGLTLGRSF